MSLSYGDTGCALENRKKFLTGLGIDYRDLVCAKQIHAGNVERVGEADCGRGALSYADAIADTDGLITDKTEVPLAIFTADCLPVFLYDPHGPGIGLVHAGWRSTRENIVVKAVRLMQEELSSSPEDLQVAFGPAIRKCCYEVGHEFCHNFAYGIEERRGRYYLDLAHINKRQLLELGVRGDNITDSEACTACRNGDFFSYRREGVSCGRMMSVVMLKG